jgi:hypothetical protein
MVAHSTFTKSRSPSTPPKPTLAPSSTLAARKLKSLVTLDSFLPLLQVLITSHFFIDQRRQRQPTYRRAPGCLQWQRPRHRGQHLQQPPDLPVPWPGSLVWVDIPTRIWSATLRLAQSVDNQLLSASMVIFSHLHVINGNTIVYSRAFLDRCIANSNVLPSRQAVSECHGSPSRID